MTDSDDIVERTNALKTYLSSVSGEKVFSGQQYSDENFPELVCIYEETGKTPAMIGFDITDDNAVENATKWYKDYNRIVSFQWHWRVPVDVNNLNGEKSYRLDETNLTIANAVKSGTVENQIILADIDAIALKLKALEDNGVPVLWRPLHEANQSFWWCRDPQSYKALWEIMYDRLTNYHGLKNLIWVWNGQDSRYLPTDSSTYDIASYDNYNSDNTTGCTDVYNAMSAYTNGKMLALSENAWLPSINEMVKNNAMWLYWMTWTGDKVYSVVDGEFGPNEVYATHKQLCENYHSLYVINGEDLPLLAAGNKTLVPTQITDFIENGHYLKNENPTWNNGKITVDFEYGNHSNCLIRQNSDCSGIGTLEWYGVGTYKGDSFCEVYVDVPTGEQGTYTAEIKYIGKYGDKYNKLYVNGVSTGERLYAASNDIQSVVFNINLVEGKNTLEMQGNAWLLLDCITLTKVNG